MPKPILRLLIIFGSTVLLAACAGQSPAPIPATNTFQPPTATPVSPSTATAPTKTTLSTPLPTAAAGPVAVQPVQPSLALFVQVDDPITYLTHAGDGSDRLFLVEKKGRVRVIRADQMLPTPFLDISGLVDAGASERGLLSIAFPPDFAASGAFYVNYTALGGGDTVVARFRVGSDPDQADPATGEEILRITQPAANHNGGQMQFGPDGYLYIGMGDGGMGGDPWDNAENLTSLLGKLLRLDVSGQPDAVAPYTIPSDNPFVGQTEARPEIWAYGLRNPWRFSFDRLTGDLWVADVGQGNWEEINFQAAGSRGGEHYGWDTMEGTHCFEPSSGCDAAGKILPVYEYDHSQGCSVTGGYVYRGAALPSLQGAYLFGDYCTGIIWVLRADGQGGWQRETLLSTNLPLASFGEDEAGEVYVVGLSGQVYRIAGE